MPVKNDVKYIKGENTDDVVKNLFKILCGIMNMPLKQRNQNPLDDVTLIQFLVIIELFFLVLLLAKHHHDQSQ